MTTSEPVLVAARDVSKEYVAEPPTSPILRLLRRLRRGSRPRRRVVAIDGVSFEVRRGERLGLVGANGAGKSTLLKLIAGIARPSRGEISVRGRVAYLGSGAGLFFSALTGRENAILLGNALGLTTSAVRARLPEIEARAGLGSAAGLPLNTYPSGLIGRLAFSVAMAADVDVLLLDETFAAADVGFRERAFAELAAEGGRPRTVILVSHSTETVRALCPRVVWLESGRLRDAGSTDEILPAYERSLSEWSPASGLPAESSQATPTHRR
jgi:ABC-type polysaccharide/polyol phosphate transport system ATPase subunit